MKIIVFDFEVFRYDVLLGVYEVNSKQYVQLWNPIEIYNYYQKNIDTIWVGHNNSDYDNHILQAILTNKNPYEISQNIVNHKKRYYLNIKLNYYDLMQTHPASLKVMEASVGKNISESEVDFNINRPLTPEEKLDVEAYNRNDLDQTFLDLKLTKSEFQLRLDLIKEFKLPLEALHYTEAQVAAKVLKATKDSSIIDKPIKPVIYPQMRLNNKIAREFYLNDDFRKDIKPKITVCGLEHQIGAGGIHAAIKNYHTDWAYYLDVSGYYNLIMIKYNLFSRTISEAGKELYEYMYHEQLRLKKNDPVKRAIYKVILLAVFGAQMHEGSDFYDPWNGALVPVVGQLFLIDLLEKLEGKITLIQSNTDGIIIKPLDGITKEDITCVINEWQSRTGLVLKFDTIYNIYQRDVNNYMYRDEDGNIHTKGEAVKYYEGWENPLLRNSYNSKEPIIIHYCIVEWFMNGIKPEQTVVKYAKELRMFQYICRLNSFDYLTFEQLGKVTKLQKVNRCFASRVPGMVYKNKGDKHDKYQNLPDKVFVWNKSLDNLNNKEIDYKYYVVRAYERINEFIPDTFKKKTTVVNKEQDFIPLI